MNRFQLYIRLVDICFWISAIYVVRSLGRLTGLFYFPWPKPFGAILGSIVAANLMLAIFLVVARFMRDEFAERIWQQAAQWFVYVLMIVPTTIGVLVAVFEEAIRLQVNNGWVEADLLAEFFRHPDPVWHFYGGVGYAVMVFALLAPSVFVCIYKCLLWCDAR